MAYAKKAKPRKKRSTHSKKIVVIGAPKRRKRRSVGATHHKKKTRKRRSGGMLGGTGTASIKQIAWMAVGVGTGAFITHVVLRPVEKKLTEKWPMIGKFIAAGEVFLGGMIALKGKNAFMKSVGVGILAGGVHGLMKQANIYKQIPNMGDTGEYSTIHVPISGSTDHILAGLLQDRARPVRTNVVAGNSRTSVLASSVHGDEWESAWDAPKAKGL